MVTQSQGYTLAVNAGLPAARAKIAAAVMMAESGGNEKQITSDSDDYSFGLWQINMKGSMGPTRRALYGLASNAALLDPATNARVMSEISHQGTTFAAWGAYTNGSYKKFLDNSISLTDAVAVGASGLPVVGGVMDTADALAKIGSAVEKSAVWLGNAKNWVRIAYVIGGGVLIYAGVETLILPYTSKAVGAVVGGATKIGGVAKTLGQKASA